MADLIDKKQLEQTIINHESETSAVVADYNSYLTGIATRQMEIIRIIRKQPTIDVANALEKQTPKKLKVGKVGRFGFRFICPNCEENIAMVWYSIWKEGLFKQKYCHNCGQALDWEGVK